MLLAELKQIKLQTLSKTFLVSCCLAALFFTVYRIKSDLEFHTYKKDFSLYFKNCEGVIPLSSYKKDFRKVKTNTYWKITAESLIFPQKKKIKAILVNDLCEKNCESSLFQHPFMDCSSFCQNLRFDFPTALSGESLKDHSFFNFQPLIKNFESQKSSCEKPNQ